MSRRTSPAGGERPGLVSSESVHPALLEFSRRAHLASAVHVDRREERTKAFEYKHVADHA